MISGIVERSCTMIVEKLLSETAVPGCAAL
jgi:hypothetical protein